MKREEKQDGRRPGVERRVYRKPRLTRVRLRLDEVLLGACKNPGWGGCNPPGHPPSRLPGS
jgi:hypothetical protein